ncbi:MAG: hypothetical protein JWM77_1297 [Rhodospirillales bacterium]|jgi:hypothetical protein|nr:hypothetical protein [Rhodospirillales bacterium]
MPQPRPHEPHRAHPRNLDQYRHQTDAGRFGDKVAVGDPAAAPIGTDEEAGGFSTPPHIVAETAAHQASIARGEPATRAREASSVRSTRRDRAAFGWLLLLFALLGFVALLYFATGGAST